MLGVARQGRAGLGWARHGEAMQGFGIIIFVQGRARRGWARHGEAGPGAAMQGKDFWHHNNLFAARPGYARRCLAGPGGAWRRKAGHSEARPVAAMQGKDFWHHNIRFDAWQRADRRGGAMHCTARQGFCHYMYFVRGNAGFGMAVQCRAWRRPARHGVARRGVPRQGVFY